MTSEPIDEVHVAAIEARLKIRADVVRLRSRVVVWEPRPCPPREERKR